MAYGKWGIGIAIVNLLHLLFNLFISDYMHDFGIVFTLMVSLVGVILSWKEPN